jgi:hypothetical protein
VRRRVVVTCCGIVSAAIAIAIGCGDPSHVYEGRLYLPARDCLGTPSSVDVVEGDRPEGNCASVCLVQPRGDAGSAFYVSTMCPPFPFGFDSTGTDPVCAPALAAFARNSTCLLDGGASAPLAPPADASTTD